MSRRPLGVSLVEILVCLGLVVVILVYVFSVIIGGLKVQSQAELIEKASSVAREQIEQIRDMPFHIVEGEFRGRGVSGPPSSGFPPTPFPSTNRGKDFFLDVTVRAQDERVWYVKVVVTDEERTWSTVETHLKR